ncbi:MAG: hypothetical protein QGG23_04735 [Candidatus Bathyarchaeota archaeon]|nr:hypothetical protein [Candidatus Bathyarchaeota archaeon]MDP7207361.1 hypothetical protein [Candidatus Bathyarchaeota archaeon]
MSHFRADVDEVMSRMMPGLDNDEYSQLHNLRDTLLGYHQTNQVKINHSVMELICAKHLIMNGFQVEIEHMIDKVSCDVFGTKGFGTALVEVETGFVSPANALDPNTYLKARIASKITRYSGFANKFILGTPPYYIMQIPPALTKPPRFRTDEEIAAIKGLCDLYYTNPPVSIEEIRNARLHSIYAIDVDMVFVREWEVNEYLGKAALWSL